MTQIVTVNVTFQGFRNQRFTNGLKMVLNNAAEDMAEKFRTMLRQLISIPVGRGGSTVGLKSILGVNVGRSSKRGKRSRHVIRSAPYEPPRKETGALTRSIRVHANRQKLIHTIYSDSPYVNALEFGYTPRNLLPRPHWLRTFSIWWRKAGRYIISAANDYILRYTP